MTTFVVPAGAGGRLDVFLNEAAGISRRMSRDRIAAGDVRVNGRPARKGQRLAAGDRIDLALGGGISDPAPVLEIAVLLEDDHLVIVDKPPGVPSVDVRGRGGASVARFLAERLPATAGTGPREGGLVQRLDNATSGVMIAAKTAAAHAELRRQLRERRVRKTYLALVHGDCAEAGTVTTPIGHVPRRPRRMAVRGRLPRAARAGARDAATEFRPLRRFGIATLLEVEIATGVRHQIRVHLASIGHPIAGDPLYALGAVPEVEPLRIPRLLLHAWRVRFVHPARRRVVRARAPMPADMREVVRLLGAETRTAGPSA